VAGAGAPGSNVELLRVRGGCVCAHDTCAACPAHMHHGHADSHGHTSGVIRKHVHGPACMHVRMHGRVCMHPTARTSPPPPLPAFSRVPPRCSPRNHRRCPPAGHSAAPSEVLHSKARPCMLKIVQQNCVHTLVVDRQHAKQLSDCKRSSTARARPSRRTTCCSRTPQVPCTHLPCQCAAAGRRLICTCRCVAPPAPRQPTTMRAGAKFEGKAQARTGQARTGLKVCRFYIENCSVFRF
jgi:hypothetical protein